MMKNSLIRVLCLLAICVLLTCCENKGPKGRYEIYDRSTDEVIEDIIEAQENDHYYYKGRVELFYELGGEWVSAGMHNLYNYPNGEGEINDFITFNGEHFPVRYADKGGYTFCVQYHGVMYYY